MTNSPRVRFAPAPTGFLHVGGARTALFNWLFARHHGGTLVLRIEDTDLERSRDEWVTGIQATLRWLGLDWDEGPYRQSERLGRYQEAAQQLLDEDRAYERDGAIWFRTPDEGTSTFTDVIRGEVTVEWENINDFAIVRSTGAPVFFLANAVDDADMGITHVIRGEDLLDSTHRVLALREALGIPGRPVFAHLPLLVGADRQKLSKRHGAVALEDFAARGYLPEALRNYLGLLGFSPPADQGEEPREILTTDELTRAFDLSEVTRSAAFFDYDKLNWMDGEYIRSLPTGELVRRALPFARDRYGDRLDEATFAGAVAIAQERMSTLVDAVDAAWFLFVPEEEFTIAPESVEQLQKTERAGDILDAVAAHLETCDWSPAGVDLRPALEGLGVKPRKALPAVYAAVEGRHVGLPLFDSIVLLGRERALRRVRAARALVG